MSPEQQARLRMLQRRNSRRLEREDAAAAFGAAGLNAVPVADDRTERLLAAFRRSSPVKALSRDHYWQQTIERFADCRFGVTIGSLWDWEGSVPLYRLAARSLIAKVDHLPMLYPSGFWLVDDNDRDAVVVDLELIEDAGHFEAHLRELRLADA